MGETMMRILIVEDEKRLAQALKQILSEAKYQTDVAENGTDGYEYAKSGIYDCVVLDVMLPGMSGFEVVRRLRGERILTPVLLLTARDTVPDKVLGLDSGADDYMTKPFSSEELLARLRVLVRRRGEISPEVLRYADIAFSPASSELSCTVPGRERSVRLSFKEAQILRLLLLRPTAILPKEDIIVRVWGYDSDAGDNNVEAYISFLRKKLLFVGAGCEIVSMKKLGYRLEEPSC